MSGITIMRVGIQSLRRQPPPQSHYLGVSSTIGEIARPLGRSRQGKELDGTIRDLVKSQADRTSPIGRPSIRASRFHIRNWRRKTLLLLLILFGSAIVFWPYQQTNVQWRPGQGAHRAILIDSLSQTDPDPFFISNVTQTLSSAGYSVDYYGPSQVTVDLFRNLPLAGYSIVIFRTHTATGPSEPPGQNIVTHQPYTTSQYSLEQLTNLVTEAVVRPGDKFFAITPNFISGETPGIGGFHGALIIQMGCSTLEARPDLATAFFGRGASAFVGWNGVVSSYYTDISTENFLSTLMHGKTLQEAVASTNGPDPDFGGQLTYIDPSSVSQQLLINQITTIVVWALILTPGLLLARRQGLFEEMRRRFKK
jgi:hypothetical protein